ncbi:MAG: hypothetical protein OH319_04825 [Candidatus Parvarchaeota archaeon]|nr:hypothetical protein [Candidatus Jingweiarchaeum tengchongense]
MSLQTYKSRFSGDIIKALVRAASELQESFFILSIDFDVNTCENVYTVEASEEFHSKATSYL